MTPHVLTGLAGGLLVGTLIGGYGPGIFYCGLIGGLGGWVLHLSRRLKELEAIRASAASTGRHAQPDPATDDPEATPPRVTMAVADISATDTLTASDPTWDSPRPPQAQRRRTGTKAAVHPPRQRIDSSPPPKTGSPPATHQ